MNPATVAAELRAALRTISLRTPPWGTEQIQAPAAIVAAPDVISYVESYGQGLIVMPRQEIVCLFGGDERSRYERASAYAATSGTNSVPALLNTYLWTSCDSVTPTECEYAPDATYAGVPYLALVFTCRIVGGP